MRKKKKLTWNELKEGKAVSKFYGMSTRETENAIRKHLDGASTVEQRKVYEEYFGNKR